MADVTLSIAGHNYTVSCRDGEEAHLRDLGQMVDNKTEEARGAVGETLGESRMLLFAALLLADEVADLRENGGDDEVTSRVEA
ncbi:MAG: cell division protein ZapA, partial [Sphingomonadaceae bacterium]|nr:cell division protein ZapA [Sphingomonadaceae bacterium]